MALQFTTSYLEDTLSLFRMYQRLSEKAMEQCTDQQLLIQLDPEANSIALIVKHLAGNLRSRWTDFLTTDGEKPTRNRDSEFQDPPATREALLKMWNEGWDCLYFTLGNLTDADLTRTITIRGEAHSGVAGYQPRLHALTRITCGQIVATGKASFQSEHWKTLTVPKNKSNDYRAARVARGEVSQR